MILGEIFTRFVEKSPVSVMVVGMIERVLGAERINEIFNQTSVYQYTRALMFSTVFDLLSYAVFEKLDKLFQEEFGENNHYFFDEIQNVPEWERYVRRLQDLGKKVLITGSNASLLSRELGTRLTGRHLTYELYPFSFNEMLLLTNRSPSLESFECNQNTAVVNPLFNPLIYSHIADLPPVLYDLSSIHPSYDLF